LEQVDGRDYCNPSRGRPGTRRGVIRKLPVVRSDEESAGNESFTSDEEDHHPVGPEERRLSTAPDRICTRLAIRVDSYTIPDAVIPCDGAHGSVVPAKLTNALYEHVEEPEAFPTIPSRTAGKHKNKQTMNCTTTLAFKAVGALWSHEPER
jgi:hypothetical protein